MPSVTLRAPDFTNKQELMRTYSNPDPRSPKNKQTPKGGNTTKQLNSSQ